MPRPKGLPLRFLVTSLVVVSAFMTLAASTFVGYRNDKDSLIRITLEMNKMNAEKVADSVDGIFETLQTSLAATADYLSRNADRVNVAEQIDLFRTAHPNFNSVILVDEYGVLRQASPVAPGTIGQKMKTAGAEQALREKRPLVTEPYASMQNRLIVMISHPLYDEQGIYRGYLGGAIYLEEQNLFGKLLTTTRNESNGSYLFVVSSSGNLLYHPDKSRLGENVAQNPAVIDLMIGKSGQRRVVNSRGVDMLAGYSIVGAAGWGIISQTPTETVLSDSRKLILRVPLYTLPVVILFIVLIYQMIGKVSDPLVKLARYASRLSNMSDKREPIPRIHTWNYEANQLHRALSTAIKRARADFDHLSLEAHTDPLTGLFNRRVMDHCIRAWVDDGVPFCLLVLDLDHFKRINDTHGHEAGDEVIRFMAMSLKSEMSADFVCCRYGGEEFVVLMPDTSPERASAYAEAIRSYMEKTNSPVGHPITLSIGIASYPGTAAEADELFRQADEALYRAKHSGRNRIESN
ncbi:sensor domain-containing diguanylate cyclase [Paenibacillus flagellatus]|uniref:Diguanylate cyclase n=1 Tax=Paenibacillus flagellatus TaxID=2211139 RepID=A0A2V5K9S7_9BACL|nr:sensor domain-containing diguanylate cyclase [Paenibacillus flagellatus]PYI56279.1 diguanylate cyclase [Paenibacillus flagellatus]